MLIQHAVAAALLLGTTVVTGVMLDARDAEPVDAEMRSDEQPTSIGSQIEEDPRIALRDLEPRRPYSGPGCFDDCTWERDADVERLREALSQGYAYSDAESIAHTPAPIRIERARPASQRWIRLDANRRPGALAECWLTGCVIHIGTW